MSGETPPLGFVAALSLLGVAADAHVLAELRRRRLPGLTVGHGYVIQRLLAGPATVSEVAEALGVTQQATSKTVQELLRLGYVHQVTDPADRRRRPVELTATGRRAVAVARKVRAELEGRITEIVGPERFATGQEVLAAAIQVLGMADDVRRRSVPPPPPESS